MLPELIIHGTFGKHEEETNYMYTAQTFCLVVIAVFVIAAGRSALADDTVNTMDFVIIQNGRGQLLMEFDGDIKFKKRTEEKREMTWDLEFRKEGLLIRREKTPWLLAVDP